MVTFRRKWGDFACIHAREPCYLVLLTVPSGKGRVPAETCIKRGYFDGKLQTGIRGHVGDFQGLKRPVLERNRRKCMAYRELWEIAASLDFAGLAGILDICPLGHCSM